MVDFSKLKDPNYLMALGQGFSQLAWSPINPNVNALAPMQAYEQRIADQNAAAKTSNAAELAQQQAKAAENKTLTALKTMYPDIAQGLEAGIIDMNGAMKLAAERRFAQTPKNWKDNYMEVGGRLVGPPGQDGKPTVVYQPGMDPKEAAAQKQEAFKTELDTMKTYRSEDAVKTYTSSRDNYEKLRSAAQLDTPQGDIALIFSFMKMLDPSSTVNSGEYANASNAGSISDTVRNMYNKVLTGERLTPEQRIEFVRAAEGQYKNTEAHLKSVNDRYTGLADQYGVPTDRFIEKPKAYEPLKIGGPAIEVGTSTGPVKLRKTGE